MGQTFGHMDSSAPNSGLSGGQLFARKALAGTLAGIGQGMQGKPVTGVQGMQSSAPAIKPMTTAPPAPTFGVGGPTGVMQGDGSQTGGAGINGNSSPFPVGPRQKPMNKFNLYG